MDVDSEDEKLAVQGSALSGFQDVVFAEKTQNGNKLTSQ